MRFSTIFKDLVVLSTLAAAPLASAQTTWNPPSNLVTGLNEVWAHQIATYSDALGFKNYGFDQLMANKGYINYCVRWESTATLTESQRAEIVAAVKKQYKKWIDWLVGFDGFPYSSVQVNVVGWAASSASQFQGSMSGYDVYTTKDSGGIPECDPRCGRFFHQNGDYSSCPGGASRHYDQSLWLTDGFGGGAGGDWGQRMGREYFMGAVNTENIHIYLHEIGHTYALDDFYDWTPTGVTNFIMLAGSATSITDFDGWMLRDWWRHLKSRYNLSTSTPTSTSTVRTTTTARTTATATPTSSTGTVALYGQCGGSGYTGPTVCAQGTCKYSNEWYSQCLN